MNGWCLKIDFYKCVCIVFLFIIIAFYLLFVGCFRVQINCALTFNTCWVGMCECMQVVLDVCSLIRVTQKKY